MRFQGAVIREQGITFAIVIVKAHVLDDRAAVERTIAQFAPRFPGMPVVLMAQDSRGTPSYFSRPDIVRFMSRVPLAAVPWKEYTVG